MNTRNTAAKINNYLFLFFTASFAGFLWEILLFFITDKGFCNRGFFYGPWLPVYGSGAVLIYFFLHRKGQYPVRCFCYSALIGAVVELFTGWLLNTLFGLRYWDYSEEFLNLGGYVCLYSVIGFALAGTAYVCFAAPFLLKHWQRLSVRMRNNCIGFLLLLAAIDIAASVIFPNKGRGITF